MKSSLFCLLLLAGPLFGQAVKPAPELHPRGYKLAPLAVRQARHAASDAIHGKRLAQMREIVKVPDSYDCRSLGQVIPALDQGKCGDCHLCSTIVTASGAYLAKGWFQGTSWAGLSLQELLDCHRDTGGCTGGDEWYDAQIVTATGLHSAIDYPGLGQRAGSCKTVSGTIYKTLSQGYADSDTGICDLLKGQVAMMVSGPLSVAFDAGGTDGYQAGQVITGKGNNVDHAVSWIGWRSNKDGTTDLLCMNSWGQDWGDNGTFWIRYGAWSMPTETFFISAPSPPVVPPVVPPVTPPVVPPSPGPVPAGTVTITLSGPLPAGLVEAWPEGSATKLDAADAAWRAFMANAKPLPVAPPSPCDQKFEELKRRLDKLQTHEPARAENPQAVILSPPSAPLAVDLADRLAAQDRVIADLKAQLESKQAPPAAVRQVWGLTHYEQTCDRYGRFCELRPVYGWKAAE